MYLGIFVIWRVPGTRTHIWLKYKPLETIQADILLWQFVKTTVLIGSLCHVLVELWLQFVSVCARKEIFDNFSSYFFAQMCNANHVEELCSMQHPWSFWTEVRYIFDSGMCSTPPPTDMISPVMNEESSDSKNATTAPHSAGSPYLEGNEHDTKWCWSLMSCM